MVGYKQQEEAQLVEKLKAMNLAQAYRDYNDGSQDQQAFNTHLYTLKLRPLEVANASHCATNSRQSRTMVCK